jgi:hypothetical protein
VVRIMISSVLAFYRYDPGVQLEHPEGVLMGWVRWAAAITLVRVGGYPVRPDGSLDAYHITLMGH